jgi:flagellar hook-associated protein 3 FlgL
MRISTPGMHYNALLAMQQQQSLLSKIQNQIATGKRVQTPADDPVAAVHILELDRALQESEQFKANADMAINRLSLEEQALQDVSNILVRVRELAVQGNNAPLDEADRRLIAIELRERLQELVDIANRRDAQGEFLFAGYATRTQPFSKTATGIAYAGDQGNRMLQIGPNQRVADSHSGFDVFLKIPEGNGAFALGASAANTGGGVLGASSVVNQAMWNANAGDYTVRFTSATGDYEILDSANNQVATGVYTEGGAIEFAGIKFEMKGMPAQNDSFTVSRSRSEDLFTTIQGLIDTLEGTSTPTEAHFATNMGQALQQLDVTADHLLQIRAQVGSRLSTLENAEAAREDLKVELKRIKSDLEDLDYAEAITRMNQQLVGLQAAQASYVQISQLSLFNYLK